ncbi:PREDICTED: cytochrome P450 CYP72A219-like [Nelumbo nucifera]|uniref:Cytochrome P450 CYP72A219-like n=2 Tax=Nelumbo nucifera TaxID=4432 RepID=A0A1U8B375_NELNU|nr:PREDICTED: cytochrome P450 CYP72A219-like [Nelumbo nucifera]DAD33839.1 TPA_asm: hypothetical protein HUJ06_012690 [Nelumbo nucifera]
MGELEFMDWVVISSVLILSWVAIVLYWIWWRPKKLEQRLKQQGIKGHPYRLLFGNLREEMRLEKEAMAKPISLSHNIVPRVIPFVHQTIQNYGRMSISWFGRTPRVYITDPELIKEILFTKFGHFERPKPNPLTKSFLRGLLSYEGEKWAKHRRLINGAFHLEKLKRMLPAFYASCSDLVTRWDSLIASKGSCELDVQPELQCLTGDIISRAAFGSSYEEGRRVFQLLNEQLNLVIQSAMYYCIPGFRFLPTKRNNRMKETRRELRTILEGIVSKREKVIKMGETTTDDLLGLLLESNLKEIQEHGNLKNVGMSIDEVIEECKLFYFAGQETTSVFLTWTMVVLSMHSEWQSRAREEVIQVFGKNKPDFDGLNQLKIVTMILYEVLRLYPPATIFGRHTYKEVRLGNICLPMGVHLSLPIILLHHSHELWGEDAQEFKPERFSEGVSKATKNQLSFFPFSWGPRICIGQNFAMIEAKMALTLILQHFSFHLSPSYTHAPHTVASLHPQHGAQIILRKL